MDDLGDEHAQGAVEDVGLSAYRGKRVLVTGHTGFKGSWLALWLAELGAEVFGLALPAAEGPGHFELAGVRDRVTHREGDVRDLGAVQASFAEARPEVVFHLAAQALVIPSYADPKGTFDTNVGGTVNLLECARSSPDVRAVVIVTSDKCYENREWEYAYRENDAMGGHDPYSASKGAAELVTAAYRRSFFHAPGRPGLCSARAGNVIGGGDWSPHRIVPDCVRALAAGQPVVVRNPRSVRPWQHVLEPLSGYLTLGARLLEEPRRYGDAFNFGPASGDQVDVEELVGLFLSAWGSGTIARLAAPPSPHDAAPHEAGLLRLSCEKAAHVLGWKPALDGREAIRWTAEWYRRWHDAHDAHDARDRDLARVSLDQIAAYTRLMDRESS
jgi:CDP-glucose 4,6-dehydratase